MTNPGRQSAPAGVWNPAVIHQLITPDRLSSYLAACHGDLSAALARYEWNTHADAALMQTIALVEVIVRNVCSIPPAVIILGSHGGADCGRLDAVSPPPRRTR